MASNSQASSSTPSTPSSPSSSGIEIARLLVQKVSRAFYGSKGAILVDQLIQKEAFRDEELGKRLGMPSKDVSKLSHRLVQDELVQLHRRSELKPGAPKASLKTYYYLDFSKTVDVIKWRMWKVQQTIDVKLRNELDAQGYVCPLCKASYTPLDAAQLYDPSRNLLACSICSTEVTNNEDEEQVKGNKDRMQRLNRQTKGIVDLLKRLEKVELPRFDIERYLAIHGPALGVTAAAQAAASGSGSTNPIQPEVKVQIAGDDDEAIEKAKREQELKEKRAQNMLPSWIAKSTIEKQQGQTGSTSSMEGEEEKREQGIVGETGTKEEDTSITMENGTGTNGGLGSVDIGGFGAAMSFYEQPDEEEEEDKPETGGDDLDAYYATLEAQNLNQSQQPIPIPNERKEEEEEGSASNFDSPSIQFEEEIIGMGSPANGTPDTTFGQGQGGGGKRSRQESIENESDTNNKKFKSAEPSPPVNSETVAASVEGEDEDEGEFHQVDGDGGVEEEENMDPNQLISVNGKMLPYSQVTEDMTSEMTADEYSAYWDVYARLNE
ncbi:uncharacterized protein JCM6883_001875 [Sporobolomyces salmoneus]|uniref:uncharacterized protein n=1 Tax=Sporobolomyces salmoneus TaxID=183962 RepID=UPI00317D3F13